ncbi:MULTISPECIES: DUF4280 domain-containing protein [unclassified Paraburkholderia]|uniref:DUF4280 domain-containing protein n=1 Tax=unclassified Paraburkholderia TaxID=2615204 RepID=UPI002AB2C2C0|nr:MULTISPECIES: DUF4280 domain-containing protein [unclassified Paraburkholderia]
MSCPQVCSGAMLQCSFGAAPGVLNVLPVNRVMAGGMPAATIMDNAPILNIAPFAMCMSPSNPAVIAATAAALGVLTPMPCVPATSAPWIPGGAPTVLIGSMPALDANATLVCMWAGMIKVVQPSQMTVLVP